MADRPLKPATHRRLGRLLPHQLANGTQTHPVAPQLSTTPLKEIVISGISLPFERLSQTAGQIIYALLTRAPLYSTRRSFTFDLHVLSMPPAFVLSQDQTLVFDTYFLLKVY